MDSPGQPEIFNWVKARSECSLSKVFFLLTEMARGDVQTMQALRNLDGVKFDHSTLDRRLVVIRTRDLGGIEESETVVFERDSHAIKVRRHDASGKPTPLFTCRPVLQPGGECRLEIDGQPFELWQISRRALEPLFFGE